MQIKRINSGFSVTCINGSKIKFRTLEQAQAYVSENESKVKPEPKKITVDHILDDGLDGKLKKTSIEAIKKIKKTKRTK